MMAMAVGQRRSSVSSGVGMVSFCWLPPVSSDAIKAGGKGERGLSVL